MRGFKIVVRHFPHEVEDLEKVVGMLHQEAADTRAANWETRYVLLLWLSIIVLIPFNMARFDSGERSPLADRILFLCKGVFSYIFSFEAVLGIRIRRILMFLGLPGSGSISQRGTYVSGSRSFPFLFKMLSRQK